MEHFHGDDLKSLSSYKGNRYWSQKAERDGNPQPREPLDGEAVYGKISYSLPERIDIVRIKGIVSDLIFGKDCNGRTPYGVPERAFRKAREYSAESTRVPSAEYAGGLQVRDILNNFIPSQT